MSNTDIKDDFQDGSSLPGIKFENVGDTVTGQILDKRERPDTDLDGKLRTWPDGAPKMIHVFDMDTDGDGKADHSLWVRGNMFTVIREALRAVEPRIPTVGAIIKVTHTAVSDRVQVGKARAKLYSCQAKAGPPIKAPVDPFAGGDEEPF